VRAVQTFAASPPWLDLSNSPDIFLRGSLNSGCDSVNSEQRGFQIYSHMASEIMR
jgi:hypothetical protein